MSEQSNLFTIHRIGFTLVPNNIVNDTRIGLKEKGLMLYLLSKPDKWETRISEIAKNNSDGITSIYTGLKRLRRLGYIKLEKTNNENGTFNFHYHIYTECHDNSEIYDPVYEISQNLIQESPHSENLNMDQPHSGNPNVVNPHMENLNHNNTDKNKTDFNNYNKEKNNKKETTTSHNDPIAERIVKVSDENEFPFKNETRKTPRVESNESWYFEKLPYGEYENVFLSPKEENLLKDKYSESVIDTVIEQLSKYQNDNNKTYSNHYSTIINWIRRQNGEYGSR